MSKSKRNRNRIGNTRKLETQTCKQKGNPLKQIRLTDANFAARLAGKYAWNIGPAGRKAQLLHRTAESGSSSLIVPLTLRLFIPLVQLGMKIEQLQAPVLSTVIIQSFYHRIRPLSLPSVTIQTGSRRRPLGIMQLHHLQQAYPAPEQAGTAANLFQTIMMHQTTFADLKEIAASLKAAEAGRPMPAVIDPAGYTSLAPRLEQVRQLVELQQYFVLRNAAQMQRPDADQHAAWMQTLPQTYAISSFTRWLQTDTREKEIHDVFSIFRTYRFRETEQQIRSAERHLNQVMLNRHVLEAVQEVVQKTRHLNHRVTEIMQKSDQRTVQESALWTRYLGRRATETIQENVQETIERSRRMYRRVTGTREEEQAAGTAPERADTIIASARGPLQRLDKGATLLHVISGTKEVQDIFSIFRTYRIRETEQQIRSAERHLNQVMLNRHVLEAVQESVQKTSHLNRRVTEIMQKHVQESALWTRSLVRRVTEAENVSETTERSRRMNRRVTETIRSEQTAGLVPERADTIIASARGPLQRLDKGAALLHVITSTKEVQGIFSIFRTYRIRETEQQTRSAELHLSQVMLNRHVLEAVQETVQKTKHLHRRTAEMFQVNLQEAIGRSRRINLRVTETIRTEEQAAGLVPEWADTIIAGARGPRQRLDKGAALLHVISGTKEVQDIFSIFRAYRIRETGQQTRIAERHLSQVMLNRHVLEVVQETVQKTRRLSRRVTETYRAEEQAAGHMPQQADLMIAGTRGPHQRLDKGEALMHVITSTKEVQDIFSIFRAYRIRETEQQTRIAERHLSQVMLNRHVLEAVQETVQKARRLSRRVTETFRDSVQETVQAAIDRTRRSNHRALDTAHAVQQSRNLAERHEAVPVIEMQTLRTIRNIRDKHLLERKELTVNHHLITEKLNIHRRLSLWERSRSYINFALMENRSGEPSPARIAATPFVVARPAQPAAAAPPEVVVQKRSAAAAPLEVASKRTAVANYEPVMKQLHTSIQKIEEDLSKAKSEWSQPQKPDIRKLTDEVYRALAGRLRFEKQRRGL